MDKKNENISKIRENFYAKFNFLKNSKKKIFDLFRFRMEKEKIKEINNSIKDLPQ